MVATPPSPRWGTISLVHRFGEHGDLADLRGAFEQHFRLHDIEAAFFEQPAEFVQSAVAFAAGDRDLDQAVQFGQMIEIVAAQRFFQPVNVELPGRRGRSRRRGGSPR